MKPSKSTKSAQRRTSQETAGKRPQRRKVADLKLRDKELRDIVGGRRETITLT
jgi:hypothetical protein